MGVRRHEAAEGAGSRLCMGREREGRKRTGVRKDATREAMAEALPKRVAGAKATEVQGKEREATMTVDTITVTFGRDAEWLRYSALSLQKFGGMFRRHVLVCNTADVPLVSRTLGPELSRLYALKPVQDREPGNLHQCAVKMTAFTYTDADRIVYLDSDELFTRALTIEDFTLGGKPFIARAPYAKLDAGHGLIWKPGVERAMGEPVEFEYMQWAAPMYFREDIEAAFRKLSGRDLGGAINFIMTSGRPKGVWGFSEFNYLGAYVAKYCPDKYALVTLGEGEQPRGGHVFHGWSRESPGLPKWQQHIKTVLG